MLEGRHGGLVGTKDLGEENGPCLLGMIMGLCLVFFVFFCKPVNVVEGPQGLLFPSGPAVLMEVSAM